MSRSEAEASASGSMLEAAGCDRDRLPPGVAGKLTSLLRTLVGPDRFYAGVDDDE